MSQDNWKHRSTMMKCHSCIWFVVKISAVEGVVNIGRCRRHCPAMTGFPVVYEDDWCGDHKLNEDAVTKKGTP